MKIVITESQYGKLLRRYSSQVPIDEMVEITIEFLDPKRFPNSHTYYNAVIAQVQSKILRDMVENDILKINDDNNNKLLPDLRKDISDYVYLNWWDKIYDYWSENKNKESFGELDEVELKERCWKGYTQKGMKTMFGKRYPNCVKIKKK